MKNRFLILFALVQTVAAAQQVLHTPEEAVKFAQVHNPNVQSALLKVKMENNTLHGAWSLLLPQAKGFTQLDYNYYLPTQLIPLEVFGGPEGQYKEVQFGTKYSFSAGVEAAMPVINTSVWMDVVAAKQGKQLADAQAQVTTEELSRQAARAFYAAVLYQELSTISKENSAASDTLLQSVLLKYENGLVDPLEMNRVRTLSNTAQQAALQNTTGAARALNNLKLLLGATDSVTIDFDLKKQTATEFSFGNRGSQVAVRQLAVQQLHTLYLKEHLKRLPEISLYTRFSGQAQRNEFDFRSTDTQPWFKIGVLGLKAELPLFTGYGRQSQINKARLRYEMAQLDLKNEVSKQQTDDTDLRLNTELSRALLETETQNYQLATDNLNIALLKYREGLFSLDQYMNVWNETLNTQSRYLKNLSDYFSNLTITKINKGEL